MLHVDKHNNYIGKTFVYLYLSIPTILYYMIAILCCVLPKHIILFKTTVNCTIFALLLLSVPGMDLVSKDKEGSLDTRDKKVVGAALE